nr:hypothetical protein [uncultured Brevundimonas sp.]
MTHRDSRDARRANGATPDGGPSPDTSDADIIRTGRRSQQAAGPDGPDASVIGETFKRKPGGPTASN